MATDHLTPTNSGDHRSEQNKFGVETRREEETRSTKHNMEENG